MKSIEDINFDDVDFSKYQDKIDKINKVMDELLESKDVQKALKMQCVRRDLGLDDNRKLAHINYIPQEFGNVEEDLLQLVFQDGTKSEASISEIILLYNYEKGTENDMNRCLYCGEERTNPINEYFCSEECSDKYDIRDDYETCEDDEVICPYCNKPQSDIADGGGYYEASGEEFECDWCHKPFCLVANAHTTFTATPTEEMIDRIYNGDTE